MLGCFRLSVVGIAISLLLLEFSASSHAINRGDTSDPAPDKYGYFVVVDGVARFSPYSGDKEAALYFKKDRFSVPAFVYSGRIQSFWMEGGFAVASATGETSDVDVVVGVPTGNNSIQFKDRARVEVYPVQSNSKYLVVTTQKKDLTSATFVVKDDGQYVRIDDQWHAKSDIGVENGYLTLANSNSAVDLDTMRVETGRLPPIKSDSEKNQTAPTEDKVAEPEILRQISQAQPKPSLSLINQRNLITTEFEHNGHKYQLVSFPYGQVRPNARGETFLVRDDGIAVRIDYKSRNLSNLKFAIKDGILQVDSPTRPKIDLERIQYEALVKIFPPNEIKKEDAQQTRTIDPVEFIEGHFRELIPETKQFPLQAIDKEVMRSIQRAFLRTGSGTAVILGSSGTGKTQLVKDLIDSHLLPRTWKFYEVNATTLGAGTGIIGTFEMKIRAMVEASKIMPIVWIADEFHSLKGQGTHSHNEVDGIQMLKSPIANGEIRFLATDTETEFYEAFGQDDAILRRFTVINKDEPKGEELHMILQNWLRENGKGEISKELIDFIVTVSSEFNAAGAQPGKSVQLLDEIFADLLLDGKSKDSLTIADIENTAQRLYHIDKAWFHPQERIEKLTRLKQLMDARIAGQELAKETLYELTQISLAEMQDTKRPRLRVLFDGPKGTGKTELALTYAEAMGLPIKVIEMGQYSSGRSPDDFLTEIARALQQNGFSVLVFDEFEKAHPAIQNTVLTLLGNGIFNYSERMSGSRQAIRTRRISALNASIIITVNASQASVGVSQSHQKQVGFMNKERETESLIQSDTKAPVDAFSDSETMDAIKAGGVSEYLLDRLQAAVTFTYLGKNEFRSIIEKTIERTFSEISRRLGITFETIDKDKYLNFLTDKYYRPNLSNRQVLRIIDSEIRASLSKSVIAGEITRGSAVSIKYENGQLLVRHCQEALMF